jgi:hypothetical protein
MLFIGRCFADTEKKKMISPQDTYNRNNRQINLSVSHLFLVFSRRHHHTKNQQTRLQYSDLFRGEEIAKVFSLFSYTSNRKKTTLLIIIV